MKMKFIASIALLTSLFSCQPQMTKDNPEDLKKVLHDYFKAIETKNYETMKAVTTDDFVIYEDGKVWNNDSMIQFIDSLPDYQAQFKLTSFDVSIDYTLGSVYYINNADFEFNDTTQLKFMWIESATLEKVEEKWRLSFLHSTLAQEW